MIPMITHRRQESVTASRALIIIHSTRYLDPSQSLSISAQLHYHRILIH
jgi:hypothetical protein